MRATLLRGDGQKPPLWRDGHNEPTRELTFRRPGSPEADVRFRQWPDQAFLFYSFRLPIFQFTPPMTPQLGFDSDLEEYFTRHAAHHSLRAMSKYCIPEAMPGTR